MDALDFFVLFDGQFHIFKKVEQLYSHSSLLNVPEVDNFLYSKKRQGSYAKPVATTFITVLNDALKCLAEYASDIPLKILETLQLIFDMDCCKFDIDGRPMILLRANIQDNIDLNWTDELTKMLNNLIKYKQYAGEIKLPDACKYWPIAVSLLALVLTFHYLEKTYIRGEYNPLTNDQINKFETYLGQLREILEKICSNLEKRQTEDFIANIRILKDFLKDDFTPFLKEMNDLLKAQLAELNNKKESELYQAAGSAMVAITSVFATYRTDGWKRFASAVSSGVSGGVTLHKLCNAQRVQKFINEHDKVQEIIKDSQNFLDGVQGYVKDVKLSDSEIPFILHEFRAFHNKVAEFQKKIAQLKK